MKRRLATLALALLFLLPACSRQAKDDAYHWVPPEKKYYRTASDGYDPASGLTYEQYLTTIDAPIIMSYSGGSSPIYDLTDSITRINIKNLQNTPHVADVSFPTLLHWLGDSIGEVARQKEAEAAIAKLNKKGLTYTAPLMDTLDIKPIEESTLMIGHYQTALREEQIGEGRKWEGMLECCVNRAMYEKLMADERVEFSGLGDIMTVIEPIYMQVTERYEDGSSAKKYMLSSQTILNFTVVGIVEDEGEYANTDAYGFFHIYAPLDMVKNLVAKHDKTQRPSYVDEAMFLPAQIIRKYAGGTTMLCRRPTADDPAKYEIRLPGGTVLPEEEWNAYFENLPVNAGYVVEITLDSGKNYAAFLEYRAAAMAEPQSAKNMYDRVYKYYEKAITDGVKNPRLNMPQILEEIAADGELDEWIVTGPTPNFVYRPLRVAP